MTKLWQNCTTKIAKQVHNTRTSKKLHMKKLLLILSLLLATQIRAFSSRTLHHALYVLHGGSALLLLCDAVPEEIEAAKTRDLSFTEKFRFRLNKHFAHLATTALILRLNYDLGNAFYEIGRIQERQRLLERIVWDSLQLAKQQAQSSSTSENS